MLEPGGACVGVFAHRGSCVTANVFVWVLGGMCVPFVSRSKGNSRWVHACFVAVSCPRLSETNSFYIDLRTHTPSHSSLHILIFDF